MSRVGFGKKLFVAAAMVALGASATVTKAATVTFASFSDSLVGGGNKWTYSNSGGTLNATSDPAFFSGIGGGVVNFTGNVTETLTATATGGVVADGSGGFDQHFSGTLTFVSAANPSLQVLQIVFTNAVLDGNPTGTTNSQFSADDSTNPGSITSFSTDPSLLIGSFAQPLKFNIFLSQIPGLTVATTGNLNNFNNFTATAGGGFQVDQSGASPTPLPAAALGGMSLMGAVGGVGAFIKRRRR